MRNPLILRPNGTKLCPELFPKAGKPRRALAASADSLGIHDAGGEAADAPIMLSAIRKALPSALVFHLTHSLGDLVSIA
jgi:hypothetical protein